MNRHMLSSSAAMSRILAYYSERILSCRRMSCWYACCIYWFLLKLIWRVSRALSTRERGKLCYIFDRFADNSAYRRDLFKKADASVSCRARVDSCSERDKASCSRRRDKSNYLSNTASFSKSRICPKQQNAIPNNQQSHVFIGYQCMTQLLRSQKYSFLNVSTISSDYLRASSMSNFRLPRSYSVISLSLSHENPLFQLANVFSASLRAGVSSWNFSLKDIWSKTDQICSLHPKNQKMHINAAICDLLTCLDTKSFFMGTHRIFKWGFRQKYSLMLCVRTTYFSKCPKNIPVHVVAFIFTILFSLQHGPGCALFYQFCLLTFQFDL